ncbi:hypothetical protein HUG17_2480 [Dermatophagoides farinae]|nr:hypothetical protein HUG17_2480 [Dermatophagoides farinae]
MFSTAECRVMLKNNDNNNNNNLDLDYAAKRLRLDKDTLSFMNEYNRHVRNIRKDVFIDTFEKSPAKIHQRSISDQSKHPYGGGINMRSIMNVFTAIGMILALIFIIILMIMASKEFYQTIDTAVATII